jgi:23S rRNA-intervening sequence protein
VCLLLRSHPQPKNVKSVSSNNIMPMMSSFEDIEAWQKARELTRVIYALTNDSPFARDFGLRDQIRRASVSIMSNIAEGFERGGDKFFLYPFFRGKERVPPRAQRSRLEALTQTPPAFRVRLRRIPSPCTFSRGRYELAHPGAQTACRPKSACARFARHRCNGF